VAEKRVAIRNAGRSSVILCILGPHGMNIAGFLRKAKRKAIQRLSSNKYS